MEYTAQMRVSLTMKELRAALTKGGVKLPADYHLVDVLGGNDPIVLELTRSATVELPE